MTRASKTRSALFTSIISLLLCVSMLVGTTFAWFTDVAETGLNQIVAGNLDVALLNAKGESVEQSTNLFTKPELWEPGAVAVAQIKVANVGNLDLKASLSINYEDVNDLNGNKLSEVLKYAIIDATGVDLEERDDVLAAAKDSGTQGSLSVYDFDIELQAGETSPVQTLVVFWDPNTDDVDNRYNANNGQKPSSGDALEINLGVKVFATQLGGNEDNEDDSFGTDYDANVSYPVEDADTLTNVLANAKDGDIFTLTENISVDELAMNANVTIDLNGKTLELGSDAQNADGLVVAEGKTLNLINNSDEKATIEYLGDDTRYDAIFVNGEGSELNIGGNVEIVVAPTASSAIHATNGAVVNIEEGTEIVVNGTTENKFTAIYIDDATVNMNGGTISISSDLAANDGWDNDVVGVMLLGDNTAFTMNGGTINVHGVNAFVQAVQIATMNGSATPSKITINGGTFNVTKEGENSESCAFAIYDPSQGTIVINNATFTGTYDDVVSTYYNGTPDITINGGTYAFDPSSYVPTEGYIVTDNGNGTYTVKPQYVVDGNTITVMDASGMDDAIAAAKNATEAVTINLPAGEMALPTDMTMNSGAYEISFVGATNADGTPATVMSLPNVTSEYIAWSVKGTIENIVFQDATNSTYIWFTDGNGNKFEGCDLAINNCTFDGASIRFNASATITDCTFDGNDAAWSGIQYSYPQGDVVIDGCTFGGYRFTNLQVTDEGAHKDLTVTVKNCTIGAMGENAVDGAEGVTIYVDNIVLENNTIDCNVWTPSFANLTATNNTTSAGGEVTYKNW